MSYCANMTQELAVVSYTPPASVAASGTVAITGIDMSYFRRILFLIQVGAVTSTGTATFVIQACSTTGGTYVTVDATNAATPSIATSNKILLLEAKAESLSAAASTAAYASYRFVGGLLTVSTAAIIVGITVLGDVGRSEPLSAQDVTAVSSIVVY